ncbi:MAG TPA: N-acetylmuramoyl-L-alanine amidase [Candidatus Tumulicola sp.]|nr:N-acetylmuramoyl-L-alanine amidase [Candidatus Tumulicola sp.]
MSWINRSIVPIFSALALLAAIALPAAADAPVSASYGRQTIRFTHVSQARGAVAVGIDDPGLRALLRATGATLTWQPGDRYVMITTAVPLVVTFAIGDRRFDVGPIALQAAFAPYQAGNEVYLPFDELLRSLDLALRQDGTAYVLQPQLDALDVRTAGNRADVVAHGGAPLRPRVTAQNATSISYEFDGVGTPLAGTRMVGAGGIRSLQVEQSGTVRDPKTTVTIALLPGAVHDVPRSNDERDVVISFAGPGGAPPAAPPIATSQAPPDAAAPPNAAPANGAATVTGVTVTPSSDGYLVSIAIAGTAAFEWHRLRDPDNRFWVDVKNAQLQGPPIDTAQPDPVGALRVRQIDPSTVRVALSLTGPKSLAVSPSATGLTVDVNQSDGVPSQMARSGTGSVGATVASSEQVPAVTPAPAGGTGDSTWKFGPANTGSYVPRNPRLIVIDPGHGGSDRGSSRHGVDEATLTLDVSKRLRDILVARGWQVRMTHDTDVDVYAPNDSAHDELQARDDVANNAGARMLVSIHANAYINSGPYGTTCYISKPSDVALAQIIERQLAADGTKDDGIVKSHLYVTLHALMPAVLIETAFISNPNDFALLTSPQWRQKIAEEIADGIDQYDRQYPASNARGQ